MQCRFWEPFTCIGVPDNKIRRLHERAANAWKKMKQLVYKLKQ